MTFLIEMNNVKLPQSVIDGWAGDSLNRIQKDRSLLPGQGNLVNKKMQVLRITILSKKNIQTSHKAV